MPFVITRPCRYCINAYIQLCQRYPMSTHVSIYMKSCRIYIKPPYHFGPYNPIITMPADGDVMDIRNKLHITNLCVYSMGYIIEPVISLCPTCPEARCEKGHRMPLSAVPATTNYTLLIVKLLFTENIIFSIWTNIVSQASGNAFTLLTIHF